jgi:hypothetical protein
MEQRRKIIIPTGRDPEETLATPHFDAEATLSAQPVVPLAEAAATPPGDAYNVRGGGAAYAPRATSSAASPWKRSTLLFIILAAVGIGIVSGLAIGLYQTRKTTTAAPVAAQPPANDSPQVATQPEPESTQPAIVDRQQPEQQPEAEARIPDTPAVKEPERKASNDADENDDNDDRRASRNNSDDSKRDRARTQPPAVRERPTVTVPIIEERDDDDRQARREERKARRREERREERRQRRDEDDDYPVNVPRSIERARQDINRIRDIFEGRQP